jgi:alpha-galactosidase|tara:strand:- start:10555 stop:12036 length:1482 start_codon:yes stop_codon:yes gene_type:complete
MAITVAVIGAGSIGFTRRLMADIVSVPELDDTTFQFHDLNEKNLEMIAQLAERDLNANDLPATVTRHIERKAALDGADYVFNVSRIGGLEAFRTDIDIPLKYGVDQCVGDTLCAGGIMYGQRGIPPMLDFCADIEAVAASDVLFMNYANPMAMLTWVANEYTNVNTLGLCHGVQGGHWLLQRIIQDHINEGIAEDAPGYRRLSKSDVNIVAAGINHQTWYIKVMFEGSDWTPRLLQLFEHDEEMQENEKVRVDMVRRFGYFSTESNGHLSEYLPWYRKRSDEIVDWISLNSWINGETGGYLRVCSEQRNWFETDFPKWMQQPAKVFSAEKRSEEHGSWIIEARETGRIYRGHFNVVNDGCITNLPDDAIVEVPGYVDRLGVNIPRVGDLPLGCAAICNASIQVQRLAVAAAVSGDLTLLRQAFMMDPLVGAVCNPAEIWQMTDEMLVAQAAWLPQYKDEIPAATKRMKAQPRKVEKEGAARVKVKSVEELRRG